jgi:hypothetical protein
MAERAQSVDNKAQMTGTPVRRGDKSRQRGTLPAHLAKGGRTPKENVVNYKNDLDESI